MDVGKFELSPPPDLSDKIVRSSDGYHEAGAFADVYKCYYNSNDGVFKEVQFLFYRPSRAAFLPQLR